MSLKAFHIVFVTASSLLSFLFGGWALNNGRTTDSLGYTVFGLAGIAFGIGMIVYGVWFWRKITTPEEDERRRRKLIRRVRSVPLVLLTLGIWLVGDSPAHACSVCFGEASGPMIDGARMGVYALFSLVLLMQIGFASFFIVLWRRGKRAHDDTEWKETREP